MSLKIDKNTLWTITPRRAKSKRFSQLSFEGFRPRGRNRVQRVLDDFGDFVGFLFKYVKRKIKRVIRSVSGMSVATVRGLRELKSFTVRKLIWSRGRLGRPVATTIVMIVALVVFMFGKVFSSSKYVVSQEVDPGYLSNVTDIIPQRNVALTTLPESRKGNEPFGYKIEPGDTLSSIGNRFKISVDALEYVNGLTDASVLKVGDELVIPPVAGLIHKVEKGDSLESIAEKYDVPSQAVADFNYILDTSSLAIGTELVIPGGSVPEPVIPLIPTPAVLTPIPGAIVDTGASKGWCRWPTTSRMISQNFSWYHNGLDITTPRGLEMPPIVSCAGGVVVRSGWDPWGLGLHVAVDHGNGYETVYGHMSRIDVGYGESVSGGQVLGIMGSTGRSTGPHVHFVVKYQGVAQNPLSYIE